MHLCTRTQQYSFTKILIKFDTHNRTFIKINIVLQHKLSKNTKRPDVILNKSLMPTTGPTRISFEASNFLIHDTCSCAGPIISNVFLSKCLSNSLDGMFCFRCLLYGTVNRNWVLDGQEFIIQSFRPGDSPCPGVGTNCCCSF